jgi:hypothetical protein
MTSNFIDDDVSTSPIPIDNSHINTTSATTYQMALCFIHIWTNSITPRFETLESVTLEAVRQSQMRQDDIFAKELAEEEEASKKQCVPVRQFSSHFILSCRLWTHWLALLNPTRLNHVVQTMNRMVFKEDYGRVYISSMWRTDRLLIPHVFHLPHSLLQ